MMTSALVAETSITITDNSPSQDYIYSDYQTTLSYVIPLENCSNLFQIALEIM